MAIRESVDLTDEPDFEQFPSDDNTSKSTPQTDSLTGIPDEYEEEEPLDVVEHSQFLANATLSQG